MYIKHRTPEIQCSMLTSSDTCVVYIQTRTNSTVYKEYTHLGMDMPTETTTVEKYGELGREEEKKQIQITSDVHMTLD